MAKLECLQASDDCAGTVENRLPLSGTALPRCDYHWEQRMQSEDDLRRRYPEASEPVYGRPEPTDPYQIWLADLDDQ